MKLMSYITQTSLYYDRITAPGTIGIIQANHSLANGWLSHSNSLMVLTRYITANLHKSTNELRGISRHVVLQDGTKENVKIVPGW